MIGPLVGFCDRTLLYGYDCDRRTWHVYQQDDQAGIGLIEIDRSEINREPVSGNCSRVRRYRTYPVDASVRVAIDRALADHRVLSIGDLV